MRNISYMCCTTLHKICYLHGKVGSYEVLIDYINSSSKGALILISIIIVLFMLIGQSVDHAKNI
jgi:succinate dehydrogenase hydrophobic anchor subunit